MIGIECPFCQRVDMIQKVTAIVEGETHETSGYSSTTNTSKISGQQNYHTRQGEHINRWREMYYCRRCDVVYVPGDDVKPQNPDKTVDLCYYGVAKR